jgi:DNA-binding transcriptional MerR regulator
MKSMDIADVAARASVKPSALRYYEELGLIAADSRKGLRRQYDASVLDRLALIAMGRRAGFSLRDIANIFGPASAAQADFTLDRDRLLSRAEEVDHRIRELAILSRALRHVARCQAPQHSQCPTFRKMMDSALQHPDRSPR